jgi:uncharacterized protein YacL
LNRILYRISFFGFCTFVGYYVAPKLFAADFASVYGALVGALVFVGVLVVEHMVTNASPFALLGGCVGLLASVIVTLMLRTALGLTDMPVAVNLGILVVCSHMGFFVGARAVKVLRLATAKEGLGTSTAPKILDTSAIIDGRVVDMVALGFVGGPLVVAQFVLNELQGIADSSDPLRRARGRRGLGILERLQSLEGAEVRIVDEDFPHIKEVDGKLVAMAKSKGATIVTTDFNLSKVAELQGIRVLNVHQLSQALRPVVLPGEPVRVTVQKNGKEPGQGVGYLEDGTMVVVENGMSHMNESIETVVTSVLQTSAGRMIFSRLPESAQVVEVKERRGVWRRRG